ncbi:TLD domain-containing protein 2 [Eublepharis macularius]|uniref:TLD domain-containing protein 2 n=1 Tax=Eublepharis macularius TaxID=481883 RepID=A0AA97JFP6_EUBMA|nr:TLD domain-containing protein 2 [Eublepharis macularius]
MAPALWNALLDEASGRHLLSTPLPGKTALLWDLLWTITDRMKTPSCRYTLLTSLIEETLSLEPEEAEQDDPACTATDAPALHREDFHEPVLNEKSNIVHLEEIQKLAPHLPLRVTGYPWNLIYCTTRDGYSLKTMYRSMTDLVSPILLVIRDTDGQIFGAFSSTTIHVSSSFYGNGEMFLFSFTPQLKVFKWTGKNTFFVKGDADSLAIGGGSGKFGLWLDGDLNHGGSHPCETFNNEALSPREEFLIQDLEVWATA